MRRKLLLERLEARTVPSFLPAVHYDAGDLARAVAVADFRDAGIVDIVTANEQAGTVSVLLGNGDGSFEPPQVIALGARPRAVAVGRFNGLVSIVTANWADHSVSVLLGNGDGTFQDPVSYAAVSNPVALAVGVFRTGGELADIAVLSGSRFGGLAVLRANEDGTFRARQFVDSLASGRFLVAPDHDGDGNLDLVYGYLQGAKHGSDSGIVVHRGVGSGSFLRGVFTTRLGSPQAAAVGDFNGDGREDLAGTGVSVYHSADASTFEPPERYVSPGALGVAVADFDNNGALDIVGVDARFVDNVGVLLGDGTGAFYGPILADADARPVAVAVGDFNGDGLSDVVTVNLQSAEVSVLLNDGDWGGKPHPGRPMSGGELLVTLEAFAVSPSETAATAHLTSEDPQPASALVERAGPRPAEGADTPARETGMQPGNRKAPAADGLLVEFSLDQD